MTPTERAKRSDALYYETVSVNRRVLCDMIANREADLEDARESVKRLMTQRDERLARAETDNAKLRELCADMWHVMWACAEQRCKHRENECYVVNGNNGALPSHDECWYKRRMRELGVDE